MHSTFSFWVLFCSKIVLQVAPQRQFLSGVDLNPLGRALHTSSWAGSTLACAFSSRVPFHTTKKHLQWHSVCQDLWRRSTLYWLRKQEATTASNQDFPLAALSWDGESGCRCSLYEVVLILILPSKTRTVASLSVNSHRQPPICVSSRPLTCATPLSQAWIVSPSLPGHF